jgi:hypothetical protein
MQDRLNEIRRRAVELARTGQYKNCSELERELLEIGDRDAHEALADRIVQMYLNGVCEAARDEPPH